LVVWVFWSFACVESRLAQSFCFAAVVITLARSLYLTMSRFDLPISHIHSNSILALFVKIFIINFGHSGRALIFAYLYYK
jgi:hypothetical protein